MTLRRVYWIPTAIALAGSALLVYWIATARPLWVDEEMLLLNVRGRGLFELAGPLWLDQSAPLGWLVLERLVLLALGPSERAVRLLTVGFGSATLMTAAWIGRRWMSVAGAALFVVLCATSEWLVFFTLELKHYSADAFGALLIPAVAAWALDATGSAPELRRRIVRWWIAAALAQWFSNGALFVTPLCAAVLAVFAARTRDRRVTAATLAGGIGWLAVFALNYLLVLRHVSGNAYLRTYWAFAFPQASNGIGATLAWIVGQFEPFARKPGSSGMPALFWLTWGAGVIFASAARRRHGLLIATVPVSALLLALLHIVPPFERLGVWVVPSLYAGIGYATDAALALVSLSAGRVPRLKLVAASAAAGIVLIVAGDIVRRGVVALVHRPRSNYGLDDRSSVRWLLASHRKGDAILTTHFGLAALWWYGQIPVSDAARGGRLADGSPIFEIGYVRAEDDCRAWRGRMAAALDGSSRAAVYLGFRLNVEPVGFDDLLLHEAARFWALDAYKQYAEESRLAIFDLTRAPSEYAGVPGYASVPGERRDDPSLRGCVAIRPAARW